SIATGPWAFLRGVGSVKYELAAFVAEIDNEHLVGRQCDALAVLVIESIDARSVAHADCDIILAGRQHDPLVDARRSISRDPRRTQAGLVDGATVHIKL